MAEVIVTLKIMPASPEVDLEALAKKAEEAITKFGGEPAKKEEEPVAFGLKALKIFFVMDESKGSTESLENEIADYDEVASAEAVDVRRAIG